MKHVHWGWLILAYLIGSFFPISKFLGSVKL